MKAEILKIFSIQEGIVQTKFLNSYQKELLDKGSKAIRKSGYCYKDYTGAYTETYIQIFIYDNHKRINVPIRQTLKDITNREKFPQKYLNTLRNNLPKIVNIEIINNYYCICDLENLLKEATKK